MKLWGRRTLNVQKVMWFMDELGLSYEHILAGGDFGRLDTPEFLAMNPHGHVPVIRDGNTVVWESHTILRYLAACYGSAQFWSEDAAVRSQSDRWMDWSETALQPDFMMGLFWNFYRTPEAQHDKLTIQKNEATCNAHFQLLDRVLEGQAFLGGDAFTLADIPAGSLLYRYFELDIERPSLPNVEAWYKRLQERDAYVKNVMLPFDDLKGRLT